MGTDIHAHFEIFQADQWVRVQVLPDIKNWDDLTQEEEQAHWNLPLFMDRDPELFAVLAGVNNHFGIQPIMPPRGIPEDLSTDVRVLWVEAHRWSEVHTPSWLLLQELLDFDWSQALPVTNKENTLEKRWIRPSWDTYADLVEDSKFITRGLPELLSMVSDPRHLRMVFWFDA